MTETQSGCFNHKEQLTKTFKSAFGITPEEYRTNPVRLNQIDKPDLLLGYVMIDEGVPLINDGIVCSFEAENFEQLVTVALNKAVKYSSQWLSRHSMTMDAYSPEMYYDSSPDGSYMELWMPYCEDR